ncbi:MAG: hypothetical protein JJ900_15915 [Rhodospirillales bacterium]|nr:hypothetical protein [Rhodospirillales bacterium]MBO6788334.1 hypothetical protein [Rhodospirillales bacterium]
MKTRIFACIAAALLVLASAPAFAGSCPLQMSKIDKALESASLSAADMGKVKGLRAKGEALHKAGKHAESVKTLKEAQEILGIN